MLDFPEWYWEIKILMTNIVGSLFRFAKYRVIVIKLQ